MLFPTFSFPVILSTYLFVSLLLGGPLAKLHGSAHLDHLILEDLDLASALTLDVMYKCVHDCRDGLTAQIWAQESLLYGV